MKAKLKFVLAWIGFLFGILLLVGGLYIEDAIQWRIHLLTGLWLLSLLPRAILNRRWQAFAPTGEVFVTRAIINITLLMGLGFGGVALQLTRNQITQANNIREYATIYFKPNHANEQEQQSQTPMLRLADRSLVGYEHVWPLKIHFGPRGTIFDRNGVVLATNQNNKRFYPNPKLSYLIGFESRLYGAAGLELGSDPYLSGSYAFKPQDLLEARLFHKPVETKPADLRLTLDNNLQQFTQDALGKRAGSVVLLEPKTGAILAMVSYPYYDPNPLVLPSPATDEDVAKVRAAWEALMNRTDSPLINRATQGRYAPGSVLKTLTAAAALDSGVMPNPEGQVTCPDRFFSEPDQRPVRNYFDGLAGYTGNPSNLRKVFAFSCNTAFAQIGLMLGPARFGEYAKRFGLPFADEASLLPDLQDLPADVGTIAGTADFLKSPLNLAETAFGQGQALVRPLDMAQMVAAIANEGNLMRPYLVQEARRGDKVVYAAQPEVLRPAISPQAASTMRSLLETSVAIGWASPVALPGVKVGGKTGTAETSSGVPHSWFVGLAPVEQPRFAIAVIVEHGGEGSQAALPLARRVLAAALGVK